jgi:hypothetical protein
MDERAIPDGVATLPAPDRGSRWGLDGVYYPATEERTVPLSGAAETTPELARLRAELDALRRERGGA